MNNTDYWERFTATGRIMDYLSYRKKENQYKNIETRKLTGDLKNGRQVNSNGDDIVHNSHW